MENHTPNVLDHRVEAEMNLSSEQQVQDEIKLYEQRKITTDVKREFSHEAVLDRPKEICLEKTWNLPQLIFYIEWKGYKYVGRKLVSKLKRDGQLYEMNCSRLTADMVLGLYITEETNDEEVKVTYCPLEDSEKLFLFDKFKATNQAYIYFPFRYLEKETKVERSSPKDGWSLDPTRAENLGIGESNLRNFTIEFLRNFDLNDKILYDPACSTGLFLNSIKVRFPDCYVIGQDLSKQMVDYAEQFLDQTFHGNAIDSPIQLESVDFCFIRFLNSEVVTTDEAKVLLSSIIQRVKRGGHIVVFGHTPVLLSLVDFQEVGLEVLQTSGYDPHTESIFEFYILKR